MTATAAKTARPATAAIAWATADGIMIEYPVKNSPHNYIVRYPKTAEGLAQALNLLIENPAPNLTPLPNHPAVQVAASTKAARERKRPGTEESRAKAAEVVRRMLK